MFSKEWRERFFWFAVWLGVTDVLLAVTALDTDTRDLFLVCAAASTFAAFTYWASDKVDSLVKVADSKKNNDRKEDE